MAIYGWLLLGLLALLGVSSSVAYHKGYKVAKTESALDMAKHIAADAKAFNEAAQRAKYVENQLEITQLNVSIAYERGRDDAEKEAMRTVADLRSGNLRLQQRWAGCETQRLSEASATASQSDAASWDRSESAGRIVRAAKQCDAQVEGLQRLLTLEREQTASSDDSSRR